MKSLEELFLEGFDAGKKVSLTFLKNIEDHGHRIFNFIESFDYDVVRDAIEGDKVTTISIYEIGGRYFAFCIEEETFWEPYDDWEGESFPSARPVRYAQPIEVNRRKRIYKEEYFDYTLKESRGQKTKTENRMDDRRVQGYNPNFKGSKVVVPVFDDNETID